MAAGASVRCGGVSRGGTSALCRRRHCRSIGCGRRHDPTKHLRTSQIPRLDPEKYDPHDPEQPSGRVLEPLWRFALTFDGYHYFGVSDAPGRLAPFATSVEEEFRKTSKLPKLGEIGMYRAALFYEQRSWCKGGKVHQTPQRDDVRYFSLLEAIRKRVP